MLAYQARQSMPRTLVCVVRLLPAKSRSKPELDGLPVPQQAFTCPGFHLLLGLQDLKGEEAWPWKILLMKGVLRGMRKR